MTRNRGMEWARLNGFIYLETSAQSGDGVGEAFQVMFKALFAFIEKGKRPQSGRSSSGPGIHVAYAPLFSNISGVGSLSAATWLDFQPKFCDLGHILARHHYDVLVIHTPRTLNHAKRAKSMKIGSCSFDQYE